MISWIQRYFQHHFRTIFLVLLAIVIISFIFTIGASPGLGRADRTAFRRPFFGYNLGAEADQQQLQADAQLSVGLQMGSFGGLDPEQLSNYALNRAASLHLADELHVPAATPEEITESIKKLRSFAGPSGEFDPEAYARFRSNLKIGGRISEAEIARILADDVRVEKVQKLLGGPGYALPEEVKSELTLSDTTWTLGTAKIDYAAYQFDAKPTDADLTKYFQDNALKYQVPAQIHASYILFPASSYIANVTPTEAEIRAFYEANPARFPKPAEVKPADPKAPAPKPDPAADYAAVRSRVEAELKLERARQLATKAASDFVFSLYTGKVANGAALQNTLAGMKLAATPLAPFSAETGPAELGGGREVAEAVSKLNAQRYYTEALPTSAGAAVVFWDSTSPSRAPTFAEVRATVSSDYIESEKRKHFSELVRSLPAQLTARLKAGDTWDKAVAAVAGTTGLKIEAKLLPPFTPRTAPPDFDYSIAGALSHLNKGEISIVSPDKGVLVYAVDKKAPDFSPGNPLLATTRTQLANISARVDATGVLAELVEQELKRTAPKEQ